MHVLRGDGARGSRLCLGGTGNNVFSGCAAKACKRLLCGCGTHDGHLSLVLANARLGTYEVHPVLSVFVCGCAEVVVAGGRKDAKDVLHLLLRVLLARNCRDLGEVDLVAQLGLVLVLVDGEAVGAQDDVDGLPLLCTC